MERRALVALEMSLNTTKACPRIRRVFSATMSRMGPNWEKMAYKDFFSSGRERYSVPVRTPDYCGPFSPSFLTFSFKLLM